MTVHHFKCSQCKIEKSYISDFTTGYARKNNNHKVCYQCCGILDRQRMIDEGTAYLYLTREDLKWEVSNWPGTYKVKADVITNKHNWYGINRYDVWFAGPDGFEWYGRLIGDNNQLFKARRTKVRRVSNTGRPVHGIRSAK